MSRKVTLKIQATVRVPILVTYTATVNVDEGHNMETLARRIIKGKLPNWADVEDSTCGDFRVLNADVENPLEDQLVDYVTEDESVNPQYLGHEVEDSR